MAIKIELKRSSVPGKVPATTELALGELAINTYDGKLFLKKNVSGTETIVDISGGGTGSIISGSINTGSLATTASLNSYTASLNAFSASIKLYTASLNLSINTGSLATTASLNSFTSSINLFSASILTYTSSLNAATSSFVLNSQTSSMSVLSASYALTASFALNTIGGSSINTGSFATTGSNTFIGNQIITGSLTLSSSAATELTVVGNSIFSGSLDINSNPSGTYGPIRINTQNSNPAAISLINLSSNPSSGSSIEFWQYQSGEELVGGMYKNSYILNNNSYLYVGSGAGVKFNYFDAGYTGSFVNGGTPYGSTYLDINPINGVNSSNSITAPTFIGSLSGNATTATTATVATTITTVNNTGDAIRYLVWAATGAGNRTPNISTTRFVVNSATGSMGINKSTITSGFNLDVAGSALISGSLAVVTGSAIKFQVTNTGVKIGNASSDNHTVTGSLLVSGSVIITGSVQGNVSTLTISTNTASIDLSRGNFFTLTLSGSTHFTATNVKPGQTVNILLTTNATNNSASFNSTIFRQPSGSAYTPTEANGAKDILTLVSYDTTNLYVASVKNLV